jgi:hypothetical protein
MRDSFVNYAGFRYLRWSLVLGVASIIAYALHEPVPQANGGTWLGYTLGTIGALLIFWLLWLGIRKRRYSSRMGTLKGWTSACSWSQRCTPDFSLAGIFIPWHTR